MPQEFQVVRCYSCQTFQGHQVKKAKKWSCKVCGEKQSYCKIYGQGNGKECRIHVQKLNALAANMQLDFDEEVAESGCTDFLVEQSVNDFRGEGSGGGASSNEYGHGGSVGLSPSRQESNLTPGRWQRYLEDSPVDSLQRHTDTESPSIDRKNFQRESLSDNNARVIGQRKRLHGEDRLLSSDSFAEKCEDFAPLEHNRVRRVESGRTFKTRFDESPKVNGFGRPPSQVASGGAAPESTESIKIKKSSMPNVETQPQPHNMSSRWGKYLEPEKNAPGQDFRKENTLKESRLSRCCLKAQGPTTASLNSAVAGSLDPHPTNGESVSSTTNIFPRLSESEWTDLLEDF